MDRSASSNYSGSLAELTNVSHHTVSSSDYQNASLTQNRTLREDLILLKKHNATFKQLLDLNPHLSQALNVSTSSGSPLIWEVSLFRLTNFSSVAHRK